MVLADNTGTAVDRLVEAINDHIAALEERAHAYYHGDVREGVLGSHDRAARRAIESLERNGCVV